MPDDIDAQRAEERWTELVRRHAEVAERSRRSEPGPPEHRPEVAILACSDARVPPEFLFDQEPGSAFIVRIAGNSATDVAVASLTYAVAELGVGLVVVLGHTGCGAVTAALAATAPAVLSPILTPIDEMLAACDTCDDVESAVIANVRHNVRRLARDRGPLGEAIAAGRVDVRGAVHDLASGHLVEVSPTTEPSNVPSH
jgi:carbonic anhydrase